MTWFPRFLNVWPAAVAAAVVLPALLALYFLKLRRRELAVPSTLLWRKAIQDLQVNAPFQKLRRNLLLLLQLLLLLLLLLALSRPITFFTPGAGRNTVIIIDRSASMGATDVNGKSRLDAAKRRARDIVDSMDKGGYAMVIAADDRAETVLESSDRVALKTAIDRIEQTERKSKLKQAYQLAEAKVNFNPEQLRANTELPDVFVLSDGRVLDGTELSIKGNLKYEKIGSDTAGNIAIVSLSAKRNYERPTEVQVFARLANYGPEPVDTDVELSVAPIDPSDPGAADLFQNSGARVVTLVPERWSDQQRADAEKEKIVARDSVEFTLDITTAAVVRVTQKNKTGDLLAADDSAQVVLPPPKSLSVLLVTEGNFFLERMLGSLSLRNPVTMSPADYESKQPKDFDVVMFDRYAPRQLPEAGNFIYFGCLPPGIAGLKPAMNNGQQVMMTEVGVLDWQRDHPMFRGLSLGKLYAAEALKVEPGPQAETLVESNKGPLIVLDREGRSVHLLIGFDLLQSNWPLRISFPVFLQNALQFMSLGTELNVREALDPGATPRIPRANLQRVDPNLKQIKLESPDGKSRTLTIPLAGDFALPPLDEVGVYRTDPIVPQFERIAVNLLDSNESNLVPVDHPPGNVGQAVSLAAGRSRLELWWWIIACGAVPLLMIEWWVYTRRVHL